MDLLLRRRKCNDKDLLGGKGANLAEMSNLGLPVPPGLPSRLKVVSTISITLISLIHFKEEVRKRLLY